ncbi:MAG TPA: hypothetical protein VIP29_02030 [Nitrososphaeraceae archaeon]
MPQYQRNINDILNRSVSELNVIQIRIEIGKANLLTESYSAEELSEYIAKNGMHVDPNSGSAIFQYGKITKEIFNALDCYRDGLNAIEIMALNSSDPYSNYQPIEED